jgi:hypothetical protein
LKFVTIEVRETLDSPSGDEVTITIDGNELATSDDRHPLICLLFEKELGVLDNTRTRSRRNADKLLNSFLTSDDASVRKLGQQVLEAFDRNATHKENEKP